MNLLLFILFSFNDTLDNHIYDKIIESIIFVESRGQDDAISPSGKFVGCLQIGEDLVKDCNRILKKRKYTCDDRFSRQKSIEMFYIIQKYYNKSNDIETAIRIWKAGAYIDEKDKLKKIRDTEVYYKKVMNHFNMNNVK